MTFKAWIRIMGLHQIKIASDLGLSPSYLSEVMTGKKKVTPDIARRIEEYTHGEVTRLEVLYPKDVEIESSHNGHTPDLFALRGSPLTTELRSRVLSGQ
jgi:DNA-binding transcriptional regulator YdaS (Cro superfamily)